MVLAIASIAYVMVCRGKTVAFPCGAYLFISIVSPLYLGSEMARDLLAASAESRTRFIRKILSTVQQVNLSDASLRSTVANCEFLDALMAYS
jgi:hypothetical protein